MAKTTKAINTVILYNSEKKEVTAIVDTGYYYSHPPHISEFVGTIEDFLTKNPNYKLPHDGEE